MPHIQPKFWQIKPLEQMSDEEWEALCDGCGRCCRIRLQNDDTEEIFDTSLACRLLDTNTCRCKNYQNRKQHVPDCLTLRPLTKQILSFLPDTCAYRLIAQGDELADWHPLVSGNPDSVLEAGISISNTVISETEVNPDDLEDYIIPKTRPS